MLKGYQADIDFANQFTGMIYEESGRGFLTQPKDAARPSTWPRTGRSSHRASRAKSPTN